MNDAEYNKLLNKLHALLNTHVREEQTLHWVKNHATLSTVAKFINGETNSSLKNIVEEIEKAWNAQFDEIRINHPMSGWLVTVSFCKKTKAFISAYFTNSTEMVILSKRLEALFQAEVIAATS